MSPAAARAARDDQRLGGGAQRGGELRAHSGARLVVRHQRQFDAGQVRRGRPHAYGVRPADTHRIDQQDLHAAIAHRTRKVTRRVPMRRHRKRRRAAAERATRRRKIGAGIGDVGELQPSSDVAQHPQRVGHATAHRDAMPSSTTGPNCVGRRTEHRDQPRSVRSPRWSVPRAARPPAHLPRHRAAARLRATRAGRTAPPSQVFSGTPWARHVASSLSNSARPTASRSACAQRERAERRSLAHGLRGRCVRSRNRWQPPCRPGWWWTASDRRSACRLPRGSPPPSPSRRGRRPAIPGW